MFRRKKPMNTVETLLHCIKLLEDKGVYIDSVSVAPELADRMREQREFIDNLDYNQRLNYKFDTQFDIFLDRKKIEKKHLKNKPKNFIGFMLGVNILKGKKCEEPF